MFETVINAYAWLKVGNNPLLDSWFLFGTPFPLFGILASYMLFVFYLGPKFMKNRKPFNLKYVIIIYNMLQVYYNFWMISTGVTDRQFTNFFFNFGCVKGITQDEMNRVHFEITRGFWHGTMNKIFDLLDTVFFVLTKKQSHITFLHVHHHSAMVVIIWVFGKYFPGIELSIVGLCNTVVHMFMYFYYLIAALGPSFKKYLWWKKYLTLLQIAQFLIVIAYTTSALWLACGFNPFVCYLIIFEAGFNLVLFLKFYVKAYGKENQFGKSIRDKMTMCGSMQNNEGYHTIHDNVTENEKKAN